MLSEDERRSLARVAYAMSLADASRLENAISEATTTVDSAEVLAEAILQGIPFAGFPAAIEAFGVWEPKRRSFAVESGGQLEPTELAELGDANFHAVYGAVADRVLKRLEAFAPPLRDWILRFAYGEVMGRSRLKLGEIEILGVCHLLAQGREAPLFSHLRGAVRNGVTIPELRRILEFVLVDAPPDRLGLDAVARALDRL